MINIRVRQTVTIVIFTTLTLVNTMPAHAMSSFSSDNNETPDKATMYKPSDWQTGNDATEDAKRAVEHDDLRLLAFAMRGYQVPGITLQQVDAYKAQCGLRIMESFGDTLKSDEQRAALKKAAAYAKAYNAVILEHCQPGNNEPGNR